ncbi:UNVERIFIED_CONTAM: hypothetical protein FKN15_075891 [Acipenser sinensis]
MFLFCFCFGIPFSVIVFCYSQLLFTLRSGSVVGPDVTRQAERLGNKELQLTRFCAF